MGEETQQILKEFGDNIEKLQEACEEYAVSTNYTDLRGFLIELRDKLQVIKTRKETYEQELQKIDLKNNEDALEEFNKKIKKYYDTIVSELKDFDVKTSSLKITNDINISFNHNEIKEKLKTSVNKANQILDDIKQTSYKSGKVPSFIQKKVKQPPSVDKLLEEINNTINQSAAQAIKKDFETYISLSNKQDSPEVSTVKSLFKIKEKIEQDFINDLKYDEEKNEKTLKEQISNHLSQINKLSNALAFEKISRSDIDPKNQSLLNVLGDLDNVSLSVSKEISELRQELKKSNNYKEIIDKINSLDLNGAIKKVVDNSLLTSMDLVIGASELHKNLVTGKWEEILPVYKERLRNIEIQDYDISRLNENPIDRDKTFISQIGLNTNSTRKLLDTYYLNAKQPKTISELLHSRMMLGSSENVFSQNNELLRMQMAAQSHLSTLTSNYSKIEDKDSRMEVIKSMGNVLDSITEQHLNVAGNINLPIASLSNLSKRDAQVVYQYINNIDDQIKQYHLIINAIKELDGNETLIKHFKKKQAELYNTKRHLQTIQESNKSLKESLKNLFSTSRSALLIMLGGLGTIFGSSSMSFTDLLSPSKWIEDIQNSLVEGGQIMYNLSRSDVALGNRVSPDSNENLLYNYEDVLYSQTFGQMNRGAIQELYSAIASSAGGQYNSNPGQTRQDLQKLSVSLIADKEVNNLDNGTIADFIKTFYKDLGLSADETSREFKKLESFASDNQIPVNTFIKAITPLAKEFRNMGISESRAVDIVTNLTNKSNMLLEDAVSIARSTANNLTKGWSSTSESNWAKNIMFGFMLGDSKNSADAIMSSMISTDRHGKVNDAYYDTTLQRMFNQLDFYGGLDTNIGQFTFYRNLKENGYSDRDASILLSVAQEGDWEKLKSKMKERSKMSDPNAPSEAVDKYSQALLTASNQLAETQKMETDYKSAINRIAAMLHKNFGDVFDRFIEMVFGELKEFVEKIKNFLNTLSKITIIKDMLSWAAEHPIQAVLGGYVASKGITMAASRLLKLPIAIAAGATGASVGLTLGLGVLLAGGVIAGIDLYRNGENSVLNRAYKYFTSPDKDIKITGENGEDIMSLLMKLGLGGMSIFALRKLLNLRHGGKALSGLKLKNAAKFLSKLKGKGSLALLAGGGAIAIDYLTGDTPSLGTAGEAGILYAGTSIGGALGGGIAGILQARFKISNPNFIKKGAMIGASIGGSLTGAGIFGYKLPGSAEASSLQSDFDYLNYKPIEVPEELQIPEEYELNYQEDLYKMSGLSVIPDSYKKQQPKSAYQKLLDENVAGNKKLGIDSEKDAQRAGFFDPDNKDKIKKGTGISNREKDSDSAEKSTFEQSEKFGMEAGKYGLSSREFASLISMSLANHKVDWGNLNDEQKKYWLEKFEEYRKLNADMKIALANASKNLSNNLSINNPDIRKKAEEAVLKEWESDDNTKGSFFQRLSEGTGYTAEMREEMKLAANYYYHSQDGVDEGFWFDQANSYHEQAKQGNLDSRLDRLFKSFTSYNKSKSLATATAQEVKDFYKWLALKNYELVKKEFITIKSKEKIEEYNKQLQVQAAGQYQQSAGAKAVEAQVWKYLAPRYGAKVAAAIMGNLQHESAGWQNDVVNEIGAKGLAQWHKERAQALDEFAAQHGADWRDVNLQMMYLDYEVQKGYGSTISTMKGQSLEDAVVQWEVDFERSEDTDSYQRRINHARRIYQQYANGVDSAGAYNPSSFGSGAGSPKVSAPPPPPPKTHEQTIKDAQNYLEKIALAKYQGAIVNGMYIDPNQKFKSLDERRKELIEGKMDFNKQAPKVKSYKSVTEMTQDKEQSKEAIKSELQSKIDEERRKLNEVKEEISKNKDLIPKKHFKDAVKIIKSIAEKYMDKVAIESNVNID